VTNVHQIRGRGGQIGKKVKKEKERLLGKDGLTENSAECTCIPHSRNEYSISLGFRELPQTSAGFKRSLTGRNKMD